MITSISAAVPESQRFFMQLAGFSGIEQELLQSTFRLTSRRTFLYEVATVAEVRPDIYLINADHPELSRLLHECAPNVHAPAMLIGSPAVLLSDWLCLPKPIQWMRLFEQLDEQMMLALAERSRRQQDAAWDGASLRRETDRVLSLSESVLRPPPMESVLVVDDSATVRAVMRKKLEPFRFDVDFAENGEDAVLMAMKKSYTCIFLDIMMPGIDGYAVCKQIKGHPRTSQTAVVMLSSKSSAFDKFRGSWAGCDAYLTKSVDEDELLSTIARFLPSARQVLHARTA